MAKAQSGKDKKSKEQVLLEAVDDLNIISGIDKDVMFDTIEKALLEEYKSQYGTDTDCIIKVDRVTGEFHIYAKRIVIPDDEIYEYADDDRLETISTMLLSEAREYVPEAQVGEEITIELPTDKFTRTASKNAKNAIVQKIREEQKNALYNEFKSQEGTLITGTIQRIDERGNVLLDIGKTQTNLRKSDQVKGEEYTVGSRIRVVVVNVDNKGKGGIYIKVSRSTPEFVKALFKEEVTEIQDGTVVIKNIAREAGSRTKMAVCSTNEDVDAVGSCVGKNGERVKRIVAELSDEQIDVIEWSDNSVRLIKNALSPARVLEIEVDEDERKAKVIVSDDQLSLAIGKAGQNVRLAAKLTNYGIDIKSESQIENEAADMDYELEDFDDELDSNYEPENKDNESEANEE